MAFRPRKNVTIHIIKNNTNNTLAIPIAVPAIVVKPNNPATKANIRNIADHLSIRHLLKFSYLLITFFYIKVNGNHSHLMKLINCFPFFQDIW